MKIIIYLLLMWMDQILNLLHLFENVQVNILNELKEQPDYLIIQILLIIFLVPGNINDENGVKSLQFNSGMTCMKLHPKIQTAFDGAKQIFP